MQDIISNKNKNLIYLWFASIHPDMTMKMGPWSEGHQAFLLVKRKEGEVDLAEGLGDDEAAPLHLPLVIDPDHRRLHQPRPLRAGQRCRVRRRDDEDIDMDHEGEIDRGCDDGIESGYDDVVGVGTMKSTVVTAKTMMRVMITKSAADTMAMRTLTTVAMTSM